MRRRWRINETWLFLFLHLSENCVFTKTDSPDTFERFPLSYCVDADYASTFPANLVITLQIPEHNCVLLLILLVSQMVPRRCCFGLPFFLYVHTAATHCFLSSAQWLVLLPLFLQLFSFIHDYTKFVVNIGSNSFLLISIKLLFSPLRSIRYCESYLRKATPTGTLFKMFYISQWKPYLVLCFMS